MLISSMQSLKIIKFIGINSLILLSFFGIFFAAGAQEGGPVTNEEVPREATLQEQRGSTEERQEVRAERQEIRAENIEERQEMRAEGLETKREDRAEAIEIRQETRAGNTEARQEVRAERAGALAEVRQKRVLNLSANISNRMEAAIARLFIISERLSARIEKLTAAGIETTAASSKLREANVYLTQARANLANIDNLVYGATTSPEPRVGWQNVRTVYAETARLIRSAHLAIRETIVLLKVATANQRQNPGTEAETAETETTE